MGKVERIADEVFALIDGKRFSVDRKPPQRGGNHRAYEDIYNELVNGERFFVIPGNKICHLETCFDHGNEEWFRQNICNPMEMPEKLTPYQKRVLKKTSNPTIYQH